LALTVWWLKHRHVIADNCSRLAVAPNRLAVGICGFRTTLTTGRFCAARQRLHCLRLHG